MVLRHVVLSLGPRSDTERAMAERLCGVTLGDESGDLDAALAAAVAFGAPLWVPALGWILEMAVVAGLQVRSISALGRWRELAARVSVWRASRYFRYGVRFLLGIALGQLFLRGDRLVLAQLMPAHEYGIYATGMQLVDVWHQVGQIIGVSIGPAYLYAALRELRVRPCGCCGHRRRAYCESSAWRAIASSPSRRTR